MNQDKLDISNRLLESRDAIKQHIKDGHSHRFLEENTRSVDEYFRACFEISSVGPDMGLEKNPYAFIALGGYGRSELCLHSDIDFLFLFKKRISNDAFKLVREIVYPLWDMGLDVGYAIRSMEECIDLANESHDILVPLFDARFICGMSVLHTDLMERLEKSIFKQKEKKIVQWLVEQNRERHEYFGDSTYRLEPNIKEGQGGLRDYHTILWLARLKYGVKYPRDLEYLGRVSHEEFKSLDRSLGFLWNVRNRLHWLTRRRCDQLHFEKQIQLAELMEYKKVNGYQPVERFLGDLHQQMEMIKQQNLMFLYEMGYLKKGKPRKRPARQSRIKGLIVERDMLNFNSLEEILENPGLLIEIFEESMDLKIPLNAEAKRIVREFSYLADFEYITSSHVIKSFERILLARSPVFNVLREMLNTGFLIRLFPEMKNIMNLIQYDEYHLYPVDKHLLRTVQTIKNFGANGNDPSSPLCHELYGELKKKKLLLWAALLHDIGKGNPEGDHSRTGAAMAETMLANRGFKKSEVETVSYLVKMHVFLIKTATRRDIHDEETAILCARRIPDIERLKMLYLLTVADSMATGPNAWNDWIATLLRTLFLRVLNILEKGELASIEVIEEMDKKKRECLALVSSDHARENVESIFTVLSPRYLLYASVGEILEDIERYQQLGDREFIWTVSRWKSANTRTVKVCAKDRPGLFSKIAGTFTMNNMDIIDAQIFTWRNQIAVDIFEVKAPPDRLYENERWAQAEKELNSALSGELDLATALEEKLTEAMRRMKSRSTKRPTRVVVDNQSSSYFTIVEVFTYDFPGLLFSITDSLFRCGLDIWVAKIATKVDQVVDIFYVRDFDGQKVDSAEQIEVIRSTVKDRIAKPVALVTGGN